MDSYSRKQMWVDGGTVSASLAVRTDAAVCISFLIPPLFLAEHVIFVVSIEIIQICKNKV